MINSKYFKKLISLVLCAAFTLTPVNQILASTASQLQAQKAYNAAQAEAARKLAEQKAAQAAAIKQQISNLDGQIDQTQTSLQETQSNIDTTSAKITELEASIKVEEDNLAAEKEKMNGTLVGWYMEGEDGFLAAMIGANNLSELVTKQEYYDSVKQQIQTTMEKIDQLKADLQAEKKDQEDQKSALSGLKDTQIAQQKTLENTKTTKNLILGMTQAQQAQYLSDANKYEREVSRITSELSALRASSAKSNGETVVVSGSGGYSVNINSWNVDPWGFVAFQCTSYGAWYWNQKLGKHWINTRPGSGSAWNWPALASDQGYSVSKTPRVGALLSWGKMAASPSYGHVAVVEAVHEDGKVDISEYNWSVSEGFDRRYNVDPGYWGSYNYIY